jgi:hypothetical protein
MEQNEGMSEDCRLNIVFKIYYSLLTFCVNFL